MIRAKKTCPVVPASGMFVIMKKLLNLFLITLAIFACASLAAYDEDDALENWVDSQTCIGRCEKAEDCISRKGDAGPNGRTACSERCIEMCETIGAEKGEFD